MLKNKRISMTAGAIAMLMALLSFILGSASFTPAMMLLFISVPLALFAAALGSWRLAVITIYFSIASLSVVPVSQILSSRIDYLLVLMGVAGAVIGGVLLYEYRKVTNID
jgi:hypothetical protein